jgi:hypothetical protein
MQFPSFRLILVTKPVQSFVCTFQITYRTLRVSVIHSLCNVNNRIVIKPAGLLAGTDALSLLSVLLSFHWGHTPPYLRGNPHNCLRKSSYLFTLQGSYPDTSSVLVKTHPAVK